MRVLIVDDNAGYRSMLRLLLMDHVPALDITEAGGAADALSHAQSSGLELVFMDLRLQQGSGFALTRTFKQAWPRCVVCVITSYALPEYRQAAIENGADHLLAKGEFTSDELAAVVESVLGCSRQIANCARTGTT